MTVFGGDITFASDLNGLEATVASLSGFGICLVQQSAQTLTSGSVTALTYGASSERFHKNNGTSWHSTSSNTSRVIPDIAGWYKCSAHTHMAAGATNYTQLNSAVGKNGTRDDPQTVTRPDPSTAALSAFVEAFMYCNGSTDYVEHFAQQTSGGNNNTSSTSGFRSTFTVVLWRPGSP